MILNCYIIDDEPLAIRLLESYVDKTPFLRLQGSCTNAVTALADLSERPVDLLFLDIQMPELNGLEFSKIDRRQMPDYFHHSFRTICRRQLSRKRTRLPAQTFLLFRFSASLRKSTSMVRIEPKSEFRTDNTAIDICQKRI